MSARYNQNHRFGRIPPVRRENREKGPTPNGTVPPGKCPVVSNVTPGPPIPGPSSSPTSTNGQQRGPVVSPTNGQQMNGQQRGPVVSPMNGQQRGPVVSPTNGQQMNGQQRGPVVSPTNGQQMNGQQMNGQQRGPVVSPTNGQQMNGQYMNGQQRGPVVSPTNGQQMNGQQRGPVVSPTNGQQMNGQQMNGQQMAPVVSPTNGQQVPGRAQIGSSRANNGAWSMLQQGGQYQSSQPVWQRDPEVRTSIGQISQAPIVSQPTQPGMRQQIWTPEPNTRSSTGQLTQPSNQLNLNEVGQSYLAVDSDGHIILARDGANYQLAGDDQGRIPIQADGQCGVWVQIVPNSTPSSGPSMAQMIRGQEGNQIISGMQSGPVSPPTPVAPTTANGIRQTRGMVSTRPNWYQQQLAQSTDDWYATQW
jgi:hypothetical protein